MVRHLPLQVVVAGKIRGATRTPRAGINRRTKRPRRLSNGGKNNALHDFCKPRTDPECHRIVPGISCMVPGDLRMIALILFIVKVIALIYLIAGVLVVLGAIGDWLPGKDNNGYTVSEDMRYERELDKRRDKWRRENPVRYTNPDHDPNEKPALMKHEKWN
jgi:hypothetical protein